MEDKEEKVHTIWVDWDNRVISFQKAEGFEELHCTTDEEMITFAVEKGFAGFGIQ